MNTCLARPTVAHTRWVAALLVPALAAGIAGVAIVSESSAAAPPLPDELSWEEEDLPRYAQVILRKLAESREPDQLLHLATKIETVSPTPGDAVHGKLLNELATAWYRIGRDAESLAVLERLAEQWPELGSLVHLEIAQIRGDRGEKELEIRALRASLQHAAINTHRSIMDADNTANIARRRLAELFEARGDWSQALAEWEAWAPTSWCGNEGVAYDHERTLAIARCQFHLGRVDEALGAVWGLVVEQNCLNGIHPESAFLYAELSAKAGRLAAAREAMTGLPEDRRDRFLVSVAVAEGFAKGDSTAMIEAVHAFELGRLRFGAPPELWGTARLLVELGGEALQNLEDRIRDRDAHAVVLAGLTGMKRFSPALQAALSADRDKLRQDLIREALERLDPPAQGYPGT